MKKMPHRISFKFDCLSKEDMRDNREWRKDTHKPMVELTPTQSARQPVNDTNTV